MTKDIRFLLNDEVITLTKIDPNLTVLQYLRKNRYLTGTKEGCASGDCGACTVVVAELNENAKTLNYKSVNACISFIGSLHGKQLITIEHLQQSSSKHIQSKSKNKLHPVQQAFVDCHASQCGFCTPGFVMSTFALNKKMQVQGRKPNRNDVEDALAGNLCRCTGYKSIIDAAMTINNDDLQDTFSQHETQTIDTLRAINLQESLQINTENHQYFAPKTANELAQLLLQYPKATIVAGGTDLALSVTQQLKTIDQLIYVGNVVELVQLSQSKDQISIGAAVPYSQFNYLLVKPFPELATMIERIGSTQIRNSGTLGGNIGNASPIGDMPPALIALSATMTLQQGENKRTIAVENYFKDYKVTDLVVSEFIKNITIPTLKNTQQLKVYKISKRLDDDISAVLAAICIELFDVNGEQQVKSIKIAFGGMAAIPKRAFNSEQALLGKVWQQASINNAKQAIVQDFQPMSDVRASSEYRITVAKNILQKCYIELSDDTIATQVVAHA